MLQLTQPQLLMMHLVRVSDFFNEHILAGRLQTMLNQYFHEPFSCGVLVETPFQEYNCLAL